MKKNVRKSEKRRTSVKKSEKNRAREEERKEGGRKKRRVKLKPPKVTDDVLGFVAGCQFSRL